LPWTVYFCFARKAEPSVLALTHLIHEADTSAVAIRAGTITVLLLLVSPAGCGGGGSASDSTMGTTGVNSTIASADCPVTQPNGERPPNEPPTDNYFGNGKLWTLLRKDSFPDEIRHGGSMVQKIPWFQPLVGVPLRITGKRLDGDAPPLRAQVAGAASEDGHQWLPSLLIFPTNGCWQVTGRSGGASLTFVTRVQTSCRTNRCLDRVRRRGHTA
jgi:hypothetical protein